MNDELSIMFCFLIICYVDINFDIPPSNHEFIDISQDSGILLQVLSHCCFFNASTCAMVTTWVMSYDSLH
jgi:hypothetical protein